MGTTRSAAISKNPPQHSKSNLLKYAWLWWDAGTHLVLFLHGETLRHRQSRLLQKHVMIGNATIRNSRPHNWVSLAATDFRENDDVPGKLRYIAASSSKQSPDPMPPILLDCGKIGLTSAISAQSVLET